VYILVETTILSMLCPNNEVAEGMMIYGTMGGWFLGYFRNRINPGHPLFQILFC
jgi:hypothetical protein